MLMVVFFLLYMLLNRLAKVSLWRLLYAISESNIIMSYRSRELNLGSFLGSFLRLLCLEYNFEFYPVYFYLVCTHHKVNKYMGSVFQTFNTTFALGYVLVRGTRMKYKCETPAYQLFMLCFDSSNFTIVHMLILDVLGSSYIYVQ